MSITLEEKGAVGDGITDDSVAVASALATNQQIILRDDGNYFVNADLAFPKGGRIRGSYSAGKDFLPRFSVGAGHNLFSFPEDAPEAQIVGAELEGFVIEGGQTAIQARNGIVWWNMREVQCTGQTGKSIVAQGFCQQWNWERVELGATPDGMPTHGLYVDNARGVGGTGSLFDKHLFTDFYTHHQSVNGVRIFSFNGTSVTFLRPTWIYAGRDGALFDGGFVDWNFIGLNNESNGYTGSTPLQGVGGSISAGNTNLAVSSTDGYSLGMNITVQGAGANGTDLYAGVSSIVPGSPGTLNLNVSASRTASGAEVVGWPCADVKFNHSINQQVSLTFIGGQSGSYSPVAATRYSLDLNGSLSTTLIGMRVVRPVYDPNNSAVVVSAAATGNFSIRKPS